MIYFDNAAAAPVDPAVLRDLPGWWEAGFANTEAAHPEAHRLRRLEADRAGGLLAACFGRVPRGAAVCWGNSASELIAMLGDVLKPQKRSSILMSPLEHEAWQAMARNENLTVSSPRLDGAGRWEAASLSAADTAVISWVQSEIGLVQDWSAISDAFRKVSPDGLMVLDAVQGIGKLAWDNSWDLPDAAVISGHKLGAPGGAALMLLTPRGQKLLPLLNAYRSEHYRTGRTEAVTVMALTSAVEYAVRDLSGNQKKIMEINRFLRSQLDGMDLPNGQKISVTLPEAVSSPYILHCRLPGYQSGVLVRMLGSAGIMTAAGSACQAESDQPSRTLLALKWSKSDAYSGLRLSFSPRNTLDEAERFVSELQQILQKY